MKRLMQYMAMFLSLSASAQAYVYPVTFHPTACDSAAALKPGSFSKVEDYSVYNWDPSFLPAMNRETGPMLQLVENCFPNASGFKAEHFRTMFKGSFIAGGPKPYEFTFVFLPFGCKYETIKVPGKDPVRKPTGEFSVASESGTWMYLFVNNPAAFFQSIKSSYTGGKKHNVYETYPIIGMWKDLEIYGDKEFQTGENLSTQGNMWALITRKEDAAFIAISRSEYLEIILAGYDAEFQAIHSGPADPELKRHTDENDARKKIVTDFIAKQSPDSLALPAVVYSHRDTDPCSEWFNPTIARRAPTRFVRSRHEYWRLDEGGAIPQMIVLKFRYENGDWNHVMIKKQFEKNFPLEAMRVMLDH